MITAIAVICFYACTDNLKEIEKMQVVSNEPIGEIENMLLKHTDSGYIKVTLAGPRMLDFTNDAFPYMEFPDGVYVKVYEQPLDSTVFTTITSDYGILYQAVELVDMRGNVTIVSSDGTVFNGDQLYWDQKAEWIFTNEEFTINFDTTGKSTGDILDSNEALTDALVRNSNDTFYVNKTDE
ncbi:LPS export ABC transporter periplasmic protein LptC [Nonlabens ponticola]|nr:LPS export ABC transporter periplasmic protein LptC [Nonlabens ponticola]